MSNIAKGEVMKMTRWYGADELRQSWCLLTLEVGQIDSERYISGCEIGDGNADQLIETESFSVRDLDGEDQLLRKIGAKLDERRYSGVSLVTPTRETLAILRTRFVACDSMKNPTLRGFDHIAISELLEAYFSENCTTLNSSLIGQYSADDPNSEEDEQSEIKEISVTALWEARTTIGSLVPPEALRGTQL